MAKLTNHYQWIRLITSSPDKHCSHDFEDDLHWGYQNISHHQQFFSELPSPRRLPNKNYRKYCDQHNQCDKWMAHGGKWMFCSQMYKGVPVFWFLAVFSMACYKLKKNRQCAADCSFICHDQNYMYTVPQQSVNHKKETKKVLRWLQLQAWAISAKIIY